MERTKRVFKTITAMILIAVFAIMPTATVFANNSASGTTGTMNSLNGQESASWPITIPNSHTGDVTGITLNLSISNGSAPLYFIITAPNGTWHRQRAVSGNNTVTAFNGRVSGSWYVESINPNNRDCFYGYWTLDC